MQHDDVTAPACTSCGRHLWDDELGHYGCGVCLRRTDARLAELAGPHGLYARLAGALAPGTVRPGGGKVSGSRTAPLPVRLEPLSLASRGGVATVLHTWLADWHDHLGWTFPRLEGGLQAQLDQAVRRLRANLPWAAEHHPAWAEFSDEVRGAVAACRAQVDGEPAPTRLNLACPCGQVLRGITLQTDGRRCAGCGQQYGWTDLRNLPLVNRRGVAA